MKITIYGAGCAKCRQTEELVRRVISELGVDAEIEKVADLEAMMRAGILLTPAVAVEDVIKVSGRVPNADEVKQWIIGCC